MDPVRFLHISDTHFGPTEDFDFHGRNPFRDSQKLLGYIAKLPMVVDFVIHTGDVVSFQNSDAYRLAEQVFSSVRQPIYYVTGNHDDSARLSKIQNFAPRNLLCGEEYPNSYYFQLKGRTFIVLDAKHSDDSNPSGAISDRQLDAFEKLVGGCKSPFVVFSHFPALGIDAPWIDKNLLIAQGEKLHRILCSQRDRCVGYFYGHLHQSLTSVIDGVSYFCVSSSTFQFAGFPTDEAILGYNTIASPGLNFVTLTGKAGQDVLVKYLSIRD